MSAPPVWTPLLLDRPKLGSARLGPEDRACIAFADQLRAWSIDGSLIATWTHIPHEVGGGGGWRSALRYAVAKALGMISGSGDYVFVWPDGGGWIEFKAAKGRASDKQQLFRAWSDDRAPGRYRLVRSAEEGFAVLREWGVLIC